jgi:hypothetical protein
MGCGLHFLALLRWDVVLQQKILTHGSRLATNAASLKLDQTSLSPYILPAMYSGLSNQRRSFLAATALASQLNWTLILPRWKLSYNVFADGGGRMLPFECFHTINTSRLTGNVLTRNEKYAHEIPEHMLQNCLAELQCSSWESCKLPEYDLMQSRSIKLGIVGLNTDATFYNVPKILGRTQSISRNSPDDPNAWLKLPFVNALRTVFDISPRFLGMSREVMTKIPRIHPQVNIVVIHARLENDFKHARTQWTRRRII